MPAPSHRPPHPFPPAVGACLALLLVLQSPDGIRAEEIAFTRLPVPPAWLAALRDADRTEYYGIYLKGRKLGWMRSSYRLGEYLDQPAYVQELVQFQSTLISGEVQETQSIDREFFSVHPPYPFLGARTETVNGDFRNTFDVRLEDESLSATTTTGDGETHHRTLDALDYTFEDAVTSEIWCLAAPGVGDSIRVRGIDWEKSALEGEHFTVGEIRHIEDGTRFLVRYTSDDGGDSGEFLVSSDGILLEGTLGGALRLVLEEEAEAKALDEKVDVFASSLTPVDTPLGDPTTVTELVLEIGGAGAERIPNGGMQEAAHDPATGLTRLTIRSRDYKPLPATNEEVAEASAATFTYPSDDETILALAERAVGNARSPYAKVKRLVEFVDSYLIDDTNAEPPTVRDIVRIRRGDCTEHAALFVTLARAVGIPAREVGGLVYGEDASMAFGGHAWCEVAIEGAWRPVDPSWGETMPNATHLRASSGSSGTSDLAILLGDLRVKVVSVRHAPPGRSLLEFPARILQSLAPHDGAPPSKSPANAP